MVNKLHLKRIVIYTQYNLLYNAREDIKIKILNSNAKTLNTLFNTHIKGTKIAPECYFEAFIDSYLFKKCPLPDQKLILFSEINKTMKSSFNNSIKSKKFQELIQSIDYYLSQSKIADLCTQMRELVKSEYYYAPETSFIAQKKELLIYTQNNLHELRELIQWITHIKAMRPMMQRNGAMRPNVIRGIPTRTMNLNNPYNALTTTQRIRMKQCGEYYEDGYYLDNLNNFYDTFLVENNYAREIFKELGGDPMEIKNMVLKSKVDALIDQNAIDMYNIDYGYNQSDKYDAKNSYMQNALPSVISGQVKDDFKELTHQTMILHSNIENFKALKNNLFNNAQITVHDEGFNPKRTKAKYYVLYTYKMNNKQLNQLYTLSEQTLSKIDAINTQKRNNVLSEYQKCTYVLNYKEQDYKARKFNKFCKYLGTETLRPYHIFLPINGKIMIPNVFANKSWWVDQKDALRFKGGNIERMPDTTHLNKDMHKILVIYDLDHALTYFWEGTQKRINVHDHRTYSTTDLFQINKCAELLKHISIDLKHNDDGAYLINYLNAMIEGRSTIDQKHVKDALDHYKKHGYIPQSNTFIAGLFLEELQKYFNYIIYRRVDTDRTIKELIDYGFRVAQKHGFPEITLKMAYNTSEVIKDAPKDKFEELLNPDSTKTYITKDRHTVVNSYYLLKAMWEISQRLNPDAQFYNILYAILLRFINVEKSCFND